MELTSSNMDGYQHAIKGYKMILTMPSHTSLETRVTMTDGAELILTNPIKGMGGIVYRNAFMRQQFPNPTNTQVT